METFKPLSNRKCYYAVCDVSFICLFQEGHKWLNSCHKVNEQTKPAIMAWETVRMELNNPFIVCLFSFLDFLFHFANAVRYTKLQKLAKSFK